MPSRSPDPVAPPATPSVLLPLGEQMRLRRKALSVSAGATAAAAGMSRQTLHRIERGEPSVTIGAYANAAQALGLELQLRDVTDGRQDADTQSSRQVETDAVIVGDYPQLKLLAWPLLDGAAELTLPGAQALALYERHWRHVDRSALSRTEQALIDALVKAHGNGVLLV